MPTCSCARHVLHVDIVSICTSCTGSAKRVHFESFSADTFPWTRREAFGRDESPMERAHRFVCNRLIGRQSSASCTAPRLAPAAAASPDDGTITTTRSRAQLSSLQISPLELLEVLNWSKAAPMDVRGSERFVCRASSWVEGADGKQTAPSSAASWLEKTRSARQPPLANCSFASSTLFLPSLLFALSFGLKTLRAVPV